jgi:CRISPR type III-associated protein (TIGR04423 family)
MASAFRKLTGLEEIPQCEYVGYLWFDNEEGPREINGTWDFTMADKLPFIIEGNLMARDTTCSISIRFLDGLYIVGMVDWSAAEGDILSEHRYLAHGFGDGRLLIFKEAWLPERDPVCSDQETLEDLETLVPSWLMFAGFAAADGRQQQEEETHD